MASLVFEKSKRFAVRIVRLYSYLCETKRESVLSKQLLKSGTSIGANLAEAECAISKNDFLAKLYISLKETSETLYWLDLLHETSFLPDNEYQSICQDATGIHKLLSSITKTLREKHEHE